MSKSSKNGNFNMSALTENGICNVKVNMNKESCFAESKQTVKKLKFPLKKSSYAISVFGECWINSSQMKKGL